MKTRIAKVLYIVLIVWCILYIGRLMNILNLPFAPDQHDAVFLGLLFPITFLLYPMKKFGIAGKILDIVLIIISLIPTWFVVFYYETYNQHAWGETQLIDIILFILIAIALLESIRRALGIVLTVILLIFMIYPMVNNYLPGILSGRGYSLERLALAYYLPDAGVFYTPLDLAATIIVAFMVFGSFLVFAGAGTTIMDIALSVVGRVRGAGAKAAVVASGIFGSINSSSAANVATAGTFTIPMMKRTGYSGEYAAGVEACASNGGHLSPPVMGSVAFVMADFLRITYAELAIFAFIPAALYYLCMFLQVDFHAARHGLKGLPENELPSFKKTVKLGWFHAIPVIVLIYLLLVVRMSAELAALISTITILIVTLFSKRTRFNLRKIVDAIWETRKGMVAVGLSTAMAGVLMASLSLTSLAMSISSQMVDIAGGNLFVLLLLAALTCFIFGMGMTSIPCYIFVAIMVAPSLLKMGIPLNASHFFVLYLAMGSFITPPVCMTTYVAAALANVNYMKAGYWATRIGIGIFIIPFAWIYNQALLLMGTPLEIAYATIVIMIGIVGLAAGLEGYLLKRATWWERLLFFVAGFMMFFPSLAIRLPGLAIILALFIFQLVLVRVRKAEEKRAVAAS